MPVRTRRLRPEVSGGDWCLSAGVVETVVSLSSLTAKGVTLKEAKWCGIVPSFITSGIEYGLLWRKLKVGR